jgi:hypothetical protein
MKISPIIVRSFSVMKSKSTMQVCVGNPQWCLCENLLENKKMKDLFSRLKNNPASCSKQIFKECGGENLLNKEWSHLSISDQIHIKECAKVWENSNSEYSAAGKILKLAIDSARRLSFERIF